MVFLLSFAESELQVTVTKADFNRATMDRFCCLIAQSQCTTQCAGQVMNELQTVKDCFLLFHMNILNWRIGLWTP